ncbi:hypothetical protein E1A91_A13G101700v1 [Gossypium mustelinum]|uniref:Photosystem II cytochrome b559 alpha subunit lumenal region domain-containing protein n=1 Tax=Gossypium mustelinum TaxID=34275 RepID=A0A5D2WG71_GOSMU|nr:hypothetical protein E1A91_A13G101700v1 [Gossypium mustelinum]
MSRVPILSSLPSPLGSSEDSVVGLLIAHNISNKKKKSIARSLEEIKPLFCFLFWYRFGSSRPNEYSKKSRQGIPLIVGRFAPLAQLNSFSRFFFRLYRPVLRSYPVS